VVPSALVENKGEFKSILVGHSFIRGFKHAMLDGLIADNLQGASYGEHFRDITNTLLYRNAAAILAREIKVNDRYKRVFTHARLISDIDDLFRAKTAILANNPDSIILNIGSNDLAALLPGFTDAQVVAIADRVRDFIQFEIPNHIIVVCMGVVPRLEGMHTSPVDFRRACVIFNARLLEHETRALQQHEPANFRYNRMVGWFMKQVGRQHLEVPVTDWCNNSRIHPTTYHYTTKFRASIQRAMIMSKNRPTFVN